MMKSRQNRYTNLQTNILIGFIVLAVLVGGTIITLLNISFQNELIHDLQQRLSNITTITALQLDGDELASITDPDDMQSSVYIKYQEKLFKIVEADDELLYIYTMRQAEDGTIYFYLDAGRNPSIAEYEPVIIGEVAYEQPTELLLNSFASPTTTIVEPDIYTDEYGSVISAYAPIFKSDGRLEGFVGVDIAADSILTRQQQLFLRSILWFLLALPFIILFGWLLGRRFARPTVVLTQEAVRIAGGDLEPIKDIPASSWETFQLTQAFNMMTLQLRELVSNLERKIAERTLEAERRTQELETASRVARDAIVTQDLDTLLNDIVNLIQSGFNLYHVSVFLVDDRNEFVALRAATGEVGQKMLEENSRLRIGETSIVGKVAESGYPRIALDVEADAVYLSHPLLPDARSEMALPLIVNKKVIGVLDLQSDQHDAFDNSSLRIMQTLADQIAVSIENARLVKRSQDALNELSQVYHAQVHDSWARQAERAFSAYEYDGLSILPANHELPQAVLEKLQAGHATIAPTNTGNNNKSSNLIVPLRLRGQLIGMVGIEKENPDYFWSEEEIAIVENAAQQVVISLENARLLEEAQRRATHEHLISEASTRMRESTDIESVLRSAAQELHKAFGNVETEVWVGTDEVKEN